MLSNRSKKSIVSFVTLFALIGFADASYLTIEHYTGGILPCNLVNGCETVTTSAYSMIGPVPLALLGALYYFSVIVALLVYFDTKKEGVLKFLGYYTSVGFVVSLVLVFLQVNVIGAICLYCMGSALSSSFLFLSSYQFVKRRKI